MRNRIFTAVARTPLRSVVAALIPVSCSAAGLMLALHHPIAPALAAAAFILWGAAVACWPRAALIALPAVLPVCGFASWTGWIAFDEFDLVVLGAIVGGHVALVANGLRNQKTPRRHGESRTLPILFLTLFATSLAFSLWTGWSAYPDYSPSLFDGYFSGLNSVRMAKPFVLVLLLLPVLQQQLRVDEAGTLSAFACGMTAGCIVVALLVVWERAAFPGVLDFSSDYRVTALFWEMHVGGAALDGFLALTVPFALWQLLRASGWTGITLGVAIAVTGYCCLVTFSRGLYVALPIAATVLVWLATRTIATGPKVSSRGAIVSVMIFVAMNVVASYVIFREGGYRGLIAAMAAIVLSFPAAAVFRTVPLFKVISLGLTGMAVSAIAVIPSTLIPKAAYLVYAILFGVCTALTLTARRTRSASATLGTAAAQGALLGAAAGVSLNWAGSKAAIDSLIALFIMWSAVLLVSRLEASRLQSARWTSVLFLGVVLSATVTAVFSGGAYMGSRLSEGERDLQTRIAHWRDTLAMMTTTQAWLFGNGLGRYPERYFYHASDARFPGSYRLSEENGAPFLVLSGPGYPTGFGELFRVSQRVRVHSKEMYSVQLDLRANRDVEVHVELCEKHLLYGVECATAMTTVAAGQGWIRRVVSLNGQALIGSKWYAPRLAFFSIAVDSIGRRVDIRRAAVFDSAGRPLLINTDFSDSMAHWFFTSDRDHLPWHTKNLALDILFAQGIVGLVIFVLLVTYGLHRLISVSSLRPDVAPCAAAMVGFLLVGLFDSLLDVPRVAFLFYLTVLIGMLVSTTRSRGSGPARFSHITRG